MKSKNLLLLLFSLVFALAIAEAVVRVVFDDRYEQRPLFYVADNQLGWIPSANLNNTFYASDYAIHIRTDAMRHRLGILGPVNYAADDLILVCGDSYTFGWGVSTAQTFASHLDYQLGEGSGGLTRVVNLGVGGYGTVQSALRVQNFVEAFPDANIAAVIMVHSHNDATDNLHSIGFHIGAYESQPAGERSSFHLINLLRFAVDTLAQPPVEPSTKKARKQPELNDVLFGYRAKRKGNGLPQIVEYGAARFRSSAITDADTNVRTMRERKDLTEIQRMLMLEGVDRLHRALKDRNIPIFHTAIVSMPKWYGAELEAAVALAKSHGNTISYVGLIPATRHEFDGPVFNSHSGGHFTDAFNRHWAHSLTQKLLDSGLIPEA